MAAFYSQASMCCGDLYSTWELFSLTCHLQLYIHILVEVHLQVALPPRNWHDKRNRQSIGDKFSLLLSALIFQTLVPNLDPLTRSHKTIHFFVYSETINMTLLSTHVNVRGSKNLLQFVSALFLSMPKGGVDSSWIWFHCDQSSMKRGAYSL